MMLSHLDTQALLNLIRPKDVHTDPQLASIVVGLCDMFQPLVKAESEARAKARTETQAQAKAASAGPELDAKAKTAPQTKAPTADQSKVDIAPSGAENKENDLPTTELLFIAYALKNMKKVFPAASALPAESAIANGLRQRGWDQSTIVATVANLREVFKKIVDSKSGDPQKFLEILRVLQHARLNRLYQLPLDDKGRDMQFHQFGQLTYLTQQSQLSPALTDNKEDENNRQLTAVALEKVLRDLLKAKEIHLDGNVAIPNIFLEILNILPVSTPKLKSFVIRLMFCLYINLNPKDFVDMGGVSQLRKAAKSLPPIAGCELSEWIGQFEYIYKKRDPFCLLVSNAIEKLLLPLFKNLHLGSGKLDSLFDSFKYDINNRKIPSCDGRELRYRFYGARFLDFIVKEFFYLKSNDANNATFSIMCPSLAGELNIWIGDGVFGVSLEKRYKHPIQLDHKHHATTSSSSSSSSSSAAAASSATLAVAPLASASGSATGSVVNAVVQSGGSPIHTGMPAVVSAPAATATAGPAPSPTPAPSSST